MNPASRPPAEEQHARPEAQAILKALRGLDPPSETHPPAYAALDALLESLADAERERDEALTRPWVDEARKAEARADALAAKLATARKALRKARIALEDERLHRQVSETAFYVEGCEACDAITTIDAVLSRGGGNGG